MENINNYLHYYLDQKCKVDSIDRIGRLVAIDIAERTAEVKYITGNNIICHIENVKMVLQKLSDMSEEDMYAIVDIENPALKNSFGVRVFKQVHDKTNMFRAELSINGTAAGGLEYSCVRFLPEVFHYLLSKGYWLWDEKAFTSGLILDAKNVK